MADTNHDHVHPVQTEGDGISYRALGVSMAVLTVVTLVCYGIVWALFLFMGNRAQSQEAPRHALAEQREPAKIVDGRIETNGAAAGPALLVQEPVNLKKFRDHEIEVLTSYAWIDQANGVVRVPVSVAKDLLVQQGLPVREGGR